MTGSDARVQGKTYVVDTSILVSAADALQHLTTNNTVLIPFPVLQELDRRRTATNGVGWTARNTVRFLDDIQSKASLDQLRSGLLGFHTKVQVHAFLKAHGVYLHYTQDDLEHDRQSGDAFRQ